MRRLGLPGIAMLLLASLGAMAGEPNPPSEVAIGKMFGVKTATYCVEIDAEGMLRNLCVRDSRGGTSTELVKELWTPREDWARSKKLSLSLTGMTQTGKNQVEVVLSSTHQETKEAVPEAFKISYTFEDAEIKARVVTKPGMFMGFEMGEAAQIAENLNDNKEMALPPLPGVRIGVLRSMRVTYADATELLFRWTGPGNPINSDEDGSIESARGRSRRIVWGMKGIAQNCEYDLTFRIVRPKSPRRVLAAPQFSIEAPVPGAIFFDGEEPRLTVTFVRQDYQRIMDMLGDQKLADARIEYKVTDQNGAEADKGAVPIDFEKDGVGGRIAGNPPPEGAIAKTIALKPGRRGYFDAAFRVVDARNVFRPVWKERPFSVVEALKPVAEERKPMADGRWDGYDRNAFLGFGLIREVVDQGVAPEKGKFVFDRKGGSLDERFRHVKERRETTGVNAHFMLFHGSGVQWAKTPQEMFEVYKATLERYKDYNTNWETLNEPNIMFKPKEYLELYLKPLKLAAEKADPKATVIGFSMCGFGRDFIEEVYKLGGKDYFDAVSIHPYIGTPYDVLFVPEITKLRQLMARYGDEAKPIWFTEGGFGWWDRASQTYDARHNVRRLLIQEQFGIPPQRDYYYFTTNMGYHKFYVMEGDGTLLPQAVALRAMRVRLDGAAYERHFGFGVRFAHCNVYKAKDRQVAVLWTYDNTRTLTLKTSASKADGYDMWGNPVKLEVKGGRLDVPASGEPTYVVLPADAGIEPIGDFPGRNVADLAFGAEAAASSEATPAGLVMDGIWSGGGWRDATADKWPDWLEIELPIPTAIHRCHIYTGGGSKGGHIRDMNLLGFADGRWAKLAEVRNNTDWILDLKFKPATVKKVKAEVLKGNGWEYVSIHEIELFAARDDGGKESKLVNWAAAENGGKASASSTWKMETEVPEPDAKRLGPNWAVSERRVKFSVEYDPSHAIDGNFTPNDWRDYVRTVWIDGTPGQFPDWLQVDLAGRKPVSAVLVFVNNFSRWRPPETGLADCDLQVWDGAAWKAAGSAKGNRKGVISFVLKEPVTTDKVRLVVNDTNDHLHSAVMEIQVLGPKD